MASYSSGALSPRRFEVNWIVSKKSDLTWFIGGALLGYGMFFLHAGLGLDMLTVWFLWIVFLDTPHFFGTYVRTFFDKEEWHNRKRLYIGSLGWFLFGPTCILLSSLLFNIGLSAYRLPFTFFVVFFNLWAYWHVVRQHYGIMSLYRRKNGEFGKLDLRLDQAILYVGLLAPFLSFVIRHPEARRILGLNYALAAFPRTSSVLGYFTPAFWSQLTWENGVLLVSVIAVTSVTAAFLVRQYQLWQDNKPLNLPKLLFLVALVPLYAYICYHPAALTAPLITFSAFVTIYHDVQYIAIVWFYNKNRYHKPGAAEKYGLATKVSRNFLTFMLCGIVMAAAFRLMGCSLEVHPGCGVLVWTSKITLFGTITTKELIASCLLGFSMQHYFLDQFIWRPSKDKTLQSDLKLAKA